MDKLIKDIEKVKDENNINIDLICFAGDLIGRGDMAYEKEMQIQLAEEHFIQPLLKAVSLTKKEFILVPGNHEVDRRKIAKRTEAGLAAISSLEEIDETIFDMQDEYKSRLQYFYDYMYKEYIPDAESWNLGYSIIKNINGISVGIVGLDSAWRSTGAGSEERGKMLIGEHQVGVLYDNIKDTDLKICLMHHPLDWVSDLEMTNIERKFNYFDLILRGHVHDLEDKQICTQRYKTIYNTSGKLYPIDNYYSGYSILNIDMNLSTCSIYSREYLKSPREEFDKALRINKNGKVEYQLTAYDESKLIEYDLKLQLKKYYEEATEKYAMLKNIDSYSPDKIGDFFVEPIIFEKSEYERSELVRKGEKREVPIQLKDLIQSEDNILFIGKKESGKTTILQRFGIFHACIESKYIPVYIDMMKLNKGKDRIFLACQNFVFNNISSDMSITKNQIRNMLLNGKLICLFDNINISNVDHCLWIQNFVRAFPDNRFIFSCEEKFYQTYTLKELPQFGAEYKSVYLEYFGRRQVREMVTKWGEGKSGFNANEMTQRIVTYCSNIHFAMTPFNIAVFMTIWDVDRNFVPVNEGKVMRTYLETVLDKFSAEDFQRSKYDYDVKQHFLGYLAYAMCQKDEYFFSIDEFNNLVDKYHDKKGFKKSESKFDVIFFEKNILCINGTCVYFSNTSIMEYCLASYAISEPTLYELMTAKGNRSNFIHELSFYSGIIPDCSKLLNSLNDEITSTILENMDILDEIEKLSINLEFDIKKDTFKEAIINNRYSIEEVDELTELKTFDQEHSPMKISKINSVEESESFMKELPIEVGEVSEKFNCSFENSGIMKDGTIYTLKTIPYYHGKQITLGDVMETGRVDEQYFIPEEKLYYTNPDITHSNEIENKLPKESRQTWQYLKGAKKLLRTSANGHEYVFSEGAISMIDQEDKPARTMLTSEGGFSRTTHIVKDKETGKIRLLTATETERIQGFPTDHTKYCLVNGETVEMPLRKRRFMMGNALVVNLISDMEKTLEKIFDNE